MELIVEKCDVTRHTIHIYVPCSIPKRKIYQIYEGRWGGAKIGYILNVFIRGGGGGCAMEFVLTDLY